jgi:cytochrome b6-f complex iron-sulfur subunit
MPTKEQVVKVWIDPGCIVCDACETTAPTVFEVTEDSCIIRPAALEVEFTRPITDLIIEAAEECPVDVIKYDLQPFEVAETAAAPAAAPAVAAPAAEPAEPQPAAAAPAAPAARPSPQPLAPAAKASPEPKGDPTLRRQLETMTARGGEAGRAKASPSQQYKDSPASNLPPDARFMRMIEAGREASSKAKPDEPSRRDFVKLTAWGSFIGASALSSYGFFVRFMFPNVLNEPEKRIRVAPLDLFREMAPGAVNNESKNFGFWIIRVEDKLAALSTTCTHLGCIPSWLDADRKFKCPCHGSGFKQNGVNFEGPAPRPLERFKVSEQDGILVVDKSRKFQYEKGEWDNPDSFLMV